MVVVGDTTLLVPVTVPIPLSMLMLVAPVTDQLSVQDPPDVMFAAEAVKLEIVGSEFAGAVLVEALPPPPQPEIVVKRNNPMPNTKEDTIVRLKIDT